MLTEIKKRKDIQILRGLAVLAVVLFHANESYFPLGYLGVDVFFLISGFVITPLILSIFTEQAKKGDKFSSLRHFYKRRFYRLAPALAVTLAISAILIFFLGSTIDHDRFSKQGIATLILAGNFGAYKYSGDYFIPYPNPLIHTWSLSVEEQIYIFMPVILLIFIYNRKYVHKIASKVLVVITFLSFFSFLFPTILMPIYSRIGLNTQLTSLISFYSPIDRIWQFTLGGLGYLFVSKNKSILYKFQNQSINQSINVVIVLGLFAILYAPITINLKLSSFLASLMTIAAIILRSFNVFPDMLSAKFEWLGDRSYSIYLFHMPLLYIAKYSPVMQIGSGENSVIQSTIAVIISIVIGSMSYTNIENRFRYHTSLSQYGSRKKLVIFPFVLLLLPFSLFLSIQKAVEHEYWGFNKHTSKATFAADLLNNCFKDSIIGPTCTIKNRGEKSVLLIGDSYAGQISLAVKTAALNSNYNFIFAPIGNIKDLQYNTDKIPSGSFYPQLENWISVNKPNLVIVSQYVQSHFSQSDMRNGLTYLKKMAPKILLIENIPVWPDKYRFNSSSLLTVPYVPPRSLPESKMDIRSKKASDNLASWARNNSILTMNFNSLFCKKEICTRYIDNEWLYTDFNHLSVAGATRTISQLETLLKRF